MSVVHVIQQDWQKASQICEYLDGLMIYEIGGSTGNQCFTIKLNQSNPTKFPKWYKHMGQE